MDGIGGCVWHCATSGIFLSPCIVSDEFVVVVQSTVEGIGSCAEPGDDVALPLRRYIEFHCHPRYQLMYILLVACLMVAVLPIASHPSWSHRRTLLFTGLIASALVPLTHWTFELVSTGPAGWIEVATFLPRVLGVFAVYGVGLAFYVTRFPESMCKATPCRLVGWPRKLGFS